MHWAATAFKRDNLSETLHPACKSGPESQKKVSTRYPTPKMTKTTVSRNNAGSHLHPAPSSPQFIQPFGIWLKPPHSVTEIDLFEISICSLSETTWKTIWKQPFSSVDTRSAWEKWNVKEKKYKSSDCCGTERKKKKSLNLKWCSEVALCWITTLKPLSRTLAWWNGSLSEHTLMIHGSSCFPWVSPPTLKGVLSLLLLAGSWSKAAVAVIAS